MEHIYAVSTGAELERYQNFVSQIQPALAQYLAYLQTEFQADDLPRAIVWTNGNIATHLISDIPVPAYTNDYRIVMTPDLDTWRSIYLKQLDGVPADSAGEIRSYYETGLNRCHILQILGHELAHHSSFFIDEAFDSGEGVWFEEGMAEYISRLWFLTDEEFQREKSINRLLVSLYQGSQSSLNDFGASTYRESYAGIFRAYWKSFLAVDQIIEIHGGDIHRVFAGYRKWYESCREQSLASWFGLC